MQIKNEDWASLLKDEMRKPYFQELENFLKQEQTKYTIYPAEQDIFNALEMTPFYDIKVVIIGQDPYHEVNQAHGLSFSVKQGVKLPPSLKNIYKEISDELGIEMSNNGDLTSWAKQGVLLLNSSLTVRSGLPSSHRNYGWENLTTAIVEIINDRLSEVVFLLWGKHAKEYSKFIDENKHFVLTAPHPSPFSVYTGFWGCGHFAKTNEILKSLGKNPINWEN